MINWSSLYSYVIRKGMILTWNHLDLILAEAILSVSVTLDVDHPQTRNITLRLCKLAL